MTDAEDENRRQWLAQDQPQSALNQYPNQLRPMTADELAYQQRLQNQHSQQPPGAGYVWQPYAMGGGQWVMPAPVRLSDEDVARIADAVVLRLRAKGYEPPGEPERGFLR